MADDLARQRRLRALRAQVRVLRDSMNATRLDYFRAQLELRELQGDATAVDRITRQIRNLLNAERPKKARKAEAA